MSRSRAWSAWWMLACALAAQQETEPKEPWPKWPVFALVLAGDAKGLERHLREHPADLALQTDNQERPIHVAADHGKADCVAVLLAAGADAAEPAYNRFTPLHLAACRGHLAAVKLLVQHKVPLDAQSVSGSPLQMAADVGARDVVLWLRNAGAAYDLPTAVIVGDQVWVEKLFAEQPDLRVDYATCTEAARRGRTAILKLLLPRSEPVPANPFGESMPQGLCLFAIGHADTVAMLLDQGEDLQQRFHPRWAQEGATLLHLAANADAAATIDVLIDKGLAVDVVDAAGWPPLLLAAQQGAAAAVETLLRRGAKAHRDAKAVANAVELAASGIDTGRSAAELAARRRIVELLLADGVPMPLLAAVVLDRVARVRELTAATPTLLTAPQGAALMGRAARMGHLDVVRTLLDAGVPVDAPDADGYTALHWAAFWNVVPAIDLLHERHATIDVATERGVTPLHEACRVGCVAAARRLLQLGADRTRRQADGETPASLAAQGEHKAEFEALWKEKS